MMFRIFGMVLTFAVVCYILYSFLSSGGQVKKTINASPAVQEQQKALKAEGIDAPDNKVLMKYSLDQAQQIQEYQNQASPEQ